MKKNSTSHSPFTLRLLVASVFCAASVVVTLLGFGAFSAQAQLKQQVIMQSTDPLVPVGFDCSRISELGIDKQENLRAGAIMIACGEAQGGKPSASSALFEAIESALAPLAYGATDVDLVTGAETSPNVTQSETATASNPDNPNQIVVAYNDSRGRNATPINISGASVSTDGGNTFTRLTNASGQSPFSNTVGDPVILYNRPTGTWFTVWLDGGCGGQGLGGYKSTTPSNPNSWTHYCIHNNNNDDRESGWADNNNLSSFYGRMYVSWNDFNVGGGAIFVRYSTDNGLTWPNSRQVTTGFFRNVQITGDLATGAVYIGAMDEMGGGPRQSPTTSIGPLTAVTLGRLPTPAPPLQAPAVALRAILLPCSTTLLTGGTWAGVNLLRLMALFTMSMPAAIQVTATRATFSTSAPLMVA